MPAVVEPISVSELQKQLSQLNDVSNQFSMGKGGNIEDSFADFVESQLGINADIAKNFQETAGQIQDLRKLFTDTFEKIESTAATKETLTQKAFNAVKGVRDNLEDLQKYVEKFSNEKNPSTASLFEMQYKVIQMSILMDISSKVGDKSSQAFQTLFRNQG